METFVGHDDVCVWYIDFFMWLRERETLYERECKRGQTSKQGSCGTV